MCADFPCRNGLALADRSAPRGQALASLVSFDLGERFYSWRGASGERYVCSVFAVGERGALAGFSGSVIVGVRRSGGERIPVCVLLSGDFNALCGEDGACAIRALGVDEWHIRFGADDAMFGDLKASLLH